ncbi:MAG TPA: hypothetical protein VFQ58_09175, partial [Flavisolibacter sp.]|nr:hypothetical protein [Flavisolibacter sp.]
NDKELSSVGGLLADYFSKKDFAGAIHLASHQIHLFHLHDFGFLFVIGVLLAIAALRTIRSVQEDGEINKSQAVGQLKVVFKKKLRSNLTKEAIVSFLNSLIVNSIQIKKRIKRRVIVMRKWNRRTFKKSA